MLGWRIGGSRKQSRKASLPQYRAAVNGVTAASTTALLTAKKPNAFSASLPINTSSLALPETPYAIFTTRGRKPANMRESRDCCSMIFGEPQAEISEGPGLQRASS